MNVLGAISVKNILTAFDSDMGAYCFRVSDFENDNWDVCADNLAEKNMWVATILKLLGLDFNQHGTNVSSFLYISRLFTSKLLSNQYYTFHFLLLIVMKTGTTISMEWIGNVCVLKAINKVQSISIHSQDSFHYRNLPPFSFIEFQQFLSL